jgi:hypothetical protein
LQKLGIREHAKERGRMENIAYSGIIDRSFQLFAGLRGLVESAITQCVSINPSYDRGEYRSEAYMACLDGLHKYSLEPDDPAHARRALKMFTLETLVFWHIKKRLCQMATYERF